MVTLHELLCKAVELHASDIHITVGIPPTFRINGELVSYGKDILSEKDTQAYAYDIMDGDRLQYLNKRGEIDCSYSIKGVGRFRVNLFFQRGSYAMVVRNVAMQPPTLQSLGMPDVIKSLTWCTKGLILVTGPTGSGKTTTLAAIVNEINTNRKCHILTLEEPVEYIHKHKKSIVNQREIGHDTDNYANALKASLREDPDVILVGEISNMETLSVVIRAAETGHLVLSSMNALCTANALTRLIEIYPPYQQQQIRLQLSMVLEGIISQQLIPRLDGSGRIPALEIMTATPLIKSLIREGKIHQIESVIQTGSRNGMKTMDTSLIELYKDGVISEQDVLMHCMDKDITQRYINI